MDLALSNRIIKLASIAKDANKQPKTTIILPIEQ